ncbi:MAG: hypothetical protein E7Y34_01235 [Mycoplasma sp.]|nr:hypothetical protein [Mycoplasma sp.]
MFFTSKKWTLFKKWGTVFSIVLSVGSAIWFVASAGSIKLDKEKVNVAFEKSFEPIYKNYIKDATEKAQDPNFVPGKDDLTLEEINKLNYVVPNDPGSYLDIVTTRGHEAADVFAYPADRLSKLKEADVLTEIPDKEIPSDKKRYTNITTYGKVNLGYPLNIETIIQIFDKSYASKNKSKGWDEKLGLSDINTIFEKDYKIDYLYPFANLWFGSALINKYLPYLNEEANIKNWIQWNKNKNQWESKYLKPTTHKLNLHDNNETNSARLSQLFDREKGLYRKVFDYYWKLRRYANNKPSYVNDSNNEKWKDLDINGKMKAIANNDNRDGNIRELLRNGVLKGIIEGPWGVNHIISFFLSGIKANSNGKKTIADAQTKTLLSNLFAAKLPKDGENGQMQHFKGGWGIGVNRLSLSRLSKEKEQEKFDIINKFIRSFTNKKYAWDWFLLGGRILATDKNAYDTNNIDIESMKLNDIMIPYGENKLLIKEFDKEIQEYVKNIYKSVIDAIFDQDKENVKQPHGPAWDLWDAFDGQSFGNEKKDTLDKVFEGIDEIMRQKLLNATKAMEFIQKDTKEELIDFYDEKN